MRDTIMKNLCVSLVIVLLLASFSGTVLAANDASDLGYKLKITVTDKNGVNADAFALGDTIHVRLSLTYTGTGKAPVYGLQGELHFDPYVIRSTTVTEKNDVQAKEKGGKITYAFLDMTGKGRADNMMENIGEVVFTAKSNGTISLYCNNFIVTNLDASQRYIDDSAITQLVIGTGIKDVTKALLSADIDGAEEMLAGCVVTDESQPGIYYPDFWITTRTEQAFRGAINLAKSIYEKEDATQSEIVSAVADLDAAVKDFEQSKIIGPRRWSGPNSYARVSASVQGSNGKIHPDFSVQRCRRNTSCTIRMMPDDGYETEYLYVNGEKFLGSDTFTIPMVSRDTTVLATFCKKPPFTDIAHSDWFYVSARYAYNNKLFNGISETEFSPDLEMSRAMLATVLYRMEGKPKVSSSSSFTDVQSGQWYSEAILWASEKNIVKGYGVGIFAPDDLVTREQIALMLYRYALSKNTTSGKAETQLNFSDVSEISEYAVESVKWAVAKGVMNGNTQTTLNPKGKATRAEVAAMLMRYIELMYGDERTNS